MSTYVLHIHFPSIAISYGDFIGTDGRRNRTTGLHENICVLLQKPRLIPRSLACQLLGCNQTNCSNCNPHNTTIIQSSETIIRKCQNDKPLAPQAHEKVTSIKYFQSLSLCLVAIASMFAQRHLLNLKMNDNPEILQ